MKTGGRPRERRRDGSCDFCCTRERLQFGAYLPVAVRSAGKNAYAPAVFGERFNDLVIDETDPSGRSSPAQRFFNAFERWAGPDTSLAVEMLHIENESER
jgi:hypothetical protein